MTLTIRSFDERDVGIVAQLHATSWRSAYRGILRDEYLDAGLDADRLDTWTAKLRDPAAGPGWLAESSGVAVGFVYTRPNEDTRWGTLVDNLHVMPGHRGLGIGRSLLNTVGRWGVSKLPHAGVHLWVFAANRPEEVR